ncbi:periaxin isoform X10, partial [Silurus asotus]
KSLQNQEEKRRLSEIVEMVVETEAEVGASGYSVVGGGTKGIFIKDVLKDSPAAKHLSLQKGDQLLSARVYFDNVKYEDALKILQCAEPYKVSFFLKRTVVQTEDSDHQNTPVIEQKGPKTKLQKMSVRSVKQFKAKKKRGGRFGLKRLKERKRTRAEEEIDNGKSAGRIKFSPVDVEFALPKIKLKKHGKVIADQTGPIQGINSIDEKTRKIKFPKLDAKHTPVHVGNINIHGPEIKGGQFYRPDIDISVPKGKIRKSVDLEGEVNKESKFQMPKIDSSLPKVKVPEGKINVKGPDIKVGKVEMPSIDISLPKGKAKGEINIKGHSGGREPVTLPKFGISLPTVKPTEVDISAEGPEIKGKKFNLPDIDIKMPKEKLKESVNLEGDASKGGKFQMPKVDLSLPSIKFPEGKIIVERPDIKEGKVVMPSIDILLPKGTANGETEFQGLSGTGGQNNFPKLDISLTKLKSPELDEAVEGPEVKGGKFIAPNIDISLPKGKVKGDVNLEGEAGKGGKFQMPKVDLSLPRIKLPEGKINMEGPDIKVGKVDMPSIDISLPKRTAKGEINIEGHSGEREPISLPKFDISLPTVKPPEVDISAEGPGFKGKKVNLPDIDIKMPKGKLKGDVNLEGEAGKGGKFQMPKVDLSLPRIKLPEEKINVEGPDIKVGKVDMPSIDISLPK